MATVSAMQAFSSTLQELVGSLPARPIPKAVFDTLVSTALSKSETQASPDNRKSNWEFVLKDDIFSLAATEGQALKDPQTTYYDDLRDRLDIVLAFTEHDACEQIFPFNVLYDLLETQTINSCSHVFSWIEARADRLTEGMVPQKGKALMLLRTLNDLLRRLSKMGATTKFCGRILTFLSSVFPLGERSGVNLRGEFGPVWEGPGAKQEEEEKQKEEEQVDGADKMQVDEEKGEASELKEASQAKDNAEDFYQTFWSLQLPFSKPPLFAEPQTLPKFKEAVNKVLPVIKEATVRERALMGSKSSSGTSSLKRKREPETVTELAGTEYFFAKYLTSPDLLDLEIDFTLEPADAQWVTETIARANEELRQTSPNGRAFADTVNVILEREKNWVKWKNELCSPFDKEAWSVEIEEEAEDGSKVKRKVGMEESTKEARLTMFEDPPEWEHKYGTAPLTEIWEMGYRDLSDLERPFNPGDVKDFVKKVKLEDQRIEMRKKQLTKRAEQIAAARAKAAAAAASQPKEVPPVVKTTPTPSSSQETMNVVSTPPASITRAAPPLTPLHHPLPAKPGTTPVKSLVAVESTPPAPATPTPAPVPTPVPAPVVVAAPEPVPVVLPPDDQIIRAEESKQRWSWLALRTARDTHIQQFGKIGTGDIILLAQEIENAKVLKEQEEKAIARGEADLLAPASQEERALSPMTGTTSSNSVGEFKVDESVVSVTNGPEAEGDVKMEA
ncbi:hypothetical protein EUX98_g2251 [Antrodiella citrinella]|uniref:Uncharacterized protein n=1 Tax=Antrodiella citrinella TaxID=2447956 RepID=A0A4V6S1X3_9APHY|nr:hypothetical protein EUX98_g2251 [Antrodiella citrinella]